MMKQKIDKRTLVRTLFMIPPMALVLCGTSQVVRYGSIQPALLAKSLPIGFVCAFLCNLWLPLGENAVWLARHLPVKNGKVISVCIPIFFSMQFAAIMTGVMCFYNVVILAHQEVPVFFRSWAKVYVPCFCMAYLVSSLWKPWADRISRKLVPLQENTEISTGLPERKEQADGEKAFPCLPGEPCAKAAASGR